MKDFVHRVLDENASIISSENWEKEITLYTDDLCEVPTEPKFNNMIKYSPNQCLQCSRGQKHYHF